MTLDFAADLGARGLIHQVTSPDLGPAMLASPFVLYAGFDPSADTLHIGNLVPLLALARAQRAGHTPIAIVGGATGMIGDPSGKSEERNLLDPDTLARNLAGIRRDLETLLDFEAKPNPARILNNADWIGAVSLIEFLRDIGKHFTVNAMLAKESVKQRIESETGISFTEFSYMLLQSWDFWHLYDRFGCRLQIGGSDQWGNITAGIDLIRRKAGPDARAAFGLTLPLILDSSGRKFGKSEKGALWLGAHRTSHFDFYQYFVRTADADAVRYLKIFTFLPLEGIADLEQEVARRPEKREAQRTLAREVTRMVRGEEGLRIAERATAVLFENARVEQLDDATLGVIFADVPSLELPRAELDAGILLIDALVNVKLAKSKSQARQLITDGGVYVNNTRNEGGLERRLGPADLASDTVCVLRAGKRNYALLRFR